MLPPTCLRQIAKSRRVPPHPAHVRNNRILIEYKQSGERQQEKVAHGNMEEALCKPPVQSSCRSVRVYSLLPRVSLSLSLSSLTILLRLFFPRESVSIPFYPRDPSFLGGSTAVGVLHLRRRYIPPCPLRCTRILMYIHIDMYIRTHVHIGGPMLRGGHVRLLTDVSLI